MAGKKFQFPLQRVLTLRNHETDKASLELARSIEERKAQEEKLAQIEAALRDAAEQSRGALPTGPLGFRRLAAHRASLQQALDREQRTLEEKRRQEEQARQRLIQRRRAQETLQSLHDEARARHHENVIRAETDFLDELAVMKHARTSSSSDS